MLKKSASLSCSFGLFGLSGLFGCMRLTRWTRQTGLVLDVRTIEFPPCHNRCSAACRSLRHLVYVEGCVRLRDHSLPQATSHRAWLILFGSTGIQLPWSTYPLAGIPVPIPRENSVNASNRRRFPAQSNCLWVFVDKNRLGPNPRGPIPAFPCICLKSINCHIVTRFPSRRMVSGSTYTVCSPGKR